MMNKDEYAFELAINAYRVAQKRFTAHVFKMPEPFCIILADFNAVVF